jgi:hypothetical protein
MNVGLWNLDKGRLVLLKDDQSLWNYLFLLLLVIVLSTIVVFQFDLH